MIIFGYHFGIRYKNIQCGKPWRVCITDNKNTFIHWRIFRTVFGALGYFLITTPKRLYRAIKQRKS